jgi:hypothetical protein
MKHNFEIYPIGTKIQSFDKDGYYVVTASGFIEQHLGDGHCIIRTFEGNCYSTVGQWRIAEIEKLN